MSDNQTPKKIPLNIMVDLETADTANTAAILAIGAVVFYTEQAPWQKNLDYDDLDFEEYIAFESVDIRNFTVSKQTMDWWNKQDPELRAKVFGGSRDIVHVLIQFNNWLNLVAGNTHEIFLWSKGADFDCKILEHAYEVLDVEWCVDFRNYRCAKTLMGLVSPEKLAKFTFVGQKHNPLDDANHQANVCAYVLSLLDNKL